MATEILSLADFTVSTGTDGGTGDFVQKAFTGKTQIWSSWQLDGTITQPEYDISTGTISLNLNGTDLTSVFDADDFYGGFAFSRTGSGDLSGLLLELSYTTTGSAEKIATLSSVTITGTYTPAAANNHAKKSALAMSGH
jgi:hypothetical protein